MSRLPRPDVWAVVAVTDIFVLGNFIFVMTKKMMAVLNADIKHYWQSPHQVLAKKTSCYIYLSVVTSNEKNM